MAHGLAGMWWLWLLLGIGWVAASFVILQFDQASIKTIGYIVGIMFFVAGLETMLLAALGRAAWLDMGDFRLPLPGRRCRRVHQPGGDVPGLADVLGFIFFIVGVWWLIRAFVDARLTSSGGWG